MTIKHLTWIALMLLFSRCGISGYATRSNPEEQFNSITDSSLYDQFQLSFITVGLGSNMGKNLPTFRVKGLRYVYTLEQNFTFSGEGISEPDTIHIGSIRSTSVDSIILLTRSIQNKNIYISDPDKTNNIFQSIAVKYNGINVTLHPEDESDTTSKMIINILNSNLPDEVKPIRLVGVTD